MQEWEFWLTIGFFTGLIWTFLGMLIESILESSRRKRQKEIDDLISLYLTYL